MKAFVLCHTHWDREWFLTSDYTNEWLVELFEKLFEILEQNKDFVFILDGQTLIVEDLLETAPQYEEKLRKFIEEGRLIIGPVYCQIDWRISPDYAIWKNFSIGKKDMEKFRAKKFCGWFVDNFGQISQLPQLLRKFGVGCAFVWRGVNPKEDGKEKAFYIWKAPDGSEVKLIFMISGYRNLYNLENTREIAFDRFKHEVEKNKAYYPFPILFDGYDLDVHPEDPRKFIDGISISPWELMKELEKQKDLQVLEGEMISGKYACVFPGTLSTRTYLKLEMEEVGRLLQTLSIFGEDQEKDWKDYLKTLIHDNICGVGIDQVHEEMEKIYFDLYSRSLERFRKILGNFNLKGKYVFVGSSYEYDFWRAFENETAKVTSRGTGIWQVGKSIPWERCDKTSFKNDYYTFRISGNAFFLNGKEIGRYLLEKDSGDAYSSWTEDMEFSVNSRVNEVYCTPHSMKIVLERQIEGNGVSVKTLEKVFLDGSPLIRWKIKLKPTGKDYKLRFGAAISEKKIKTMMPFDVVEREVEDKDLFDQNLPENLSDILLAARECRVVNEFPFQNYVTGKEISILAKGLREYKADDRGLWVTLTRATEWITKKVKGRTGDAGPYMYVPGARAEREMEIEVAFMPEVKNWRKWAELFRKPFVLFESYGKYEKNIHMFFYKGSWVLREGEKLIVIDRKKIKESDLDLSNIINNDKASKVKILEGIEFPVKIEEALPDRKVLKEMKNRIKLLKKEKERLSSKINSLKGLEYHRVMHRIYSIEREILELMLSIELNKLKLGESSKEKIREIGWKLNDARRKRRTYDYILEFYESRERHDRKN
ncbi:MAG: alpha-mannosidase [Thermotogaceae bacterium]|nr:alpha-mannosidase [Thermotogaceae bacterium]